LRSRTDYHMGFWIRYKPQKDYTIHYNIMTVQMDKPLGGIFK